jgi:hypothetical protein
MKNQPWTLNYVNTTVHHARLSSNFDSLTNPAFILPNGQVTDTFTEIIFTFSAFYSKNAQPGVQTELFLYYLDSKQIKCCYNE